jgi:hypothetical protein
VRELERERVTVQQAAARLGITESAVRKRVRKGDLRSEKVLEGNRERLYVFLDPDAEPFPEPFREKYMRTLEDRVRTLEDEVMRQQAIILSMSQSVRALTDAPEASQSAEEAQEGAEPRPSNGGAVQEPTRPPASSAPTWRLGMSARVLVLGATVTLLVAACLSWFAVERSWFAFEDFQGIGLFAGGFLGVVLLFGLCAGYTKRPSLPWFSWPHTWLRRSGRSVVKIALFAAGMPATAGFLTGAYYAAGGGVIGGVKTFWGVILRFDAFFFLFIGLLVGIASLGFMSGAFLGNALRRFGVLGTPKEPPQGEDEGEQEEVWSPRKEAQWGLAGSVIVALISALASVVAATLSQ